MEACASAHYWGRRFVATGHRVLLINPRFVKAFVKGSKNDAANAEGVKLPRDRRCASCRLNRSNNSIFNPFTARATASSVLEQPLSTILEDFLASMALSRHKA
jgi:transposase